MLPSEFSVQQGTFLSSSLIQQFTHRAPYEIFLSAGNERLDLQFQQLFFSKLNILEDNGPDVLSNIRELLEFKFK